MRLFGIKAGVCALVVSTSIVVHAADNSATVESQPQRDIAIALAKFESHKGNQDAALLALEQASVIYPSDDNSDRLVFKADLLVSAGRFEDARGLFGQLMGQKSKAMKLMQEIALPLAELNFANGDCSKALRLLKVKKNKTIEQRQQSFFIRATCLVASEEMNLQQLTDLDQQMQDFLSEVDRSEITLWSAYGYYNLALSALNAGMITEAGSFFEKVFQYIDSAALADVRTVEEGRALRERALLTVAGAYFASSQYGLAMEYYALLSIDGYWNDKALLGYGWAAFNNFQRGLALESWRQLAYLPNKSMSVYEGLLAIPFALEKANAYSRALVAYDGAIEEFDIALAQIESLKQSLSVDDIRHHALEYFDSRGRSIKPLHPLLGYTYTQPKFSASIKRIGEVVSTQKKLEAQKSELGVLAQISGWKRGVSTVQTSALESQVNKRLKGFFAEIVNLREVMISEAVEEGRVDKEFLGKYNRYLSLRRISTASSGVGSDRLAKLQGVLFWQMLEQSDYPRERLTALNELLSLHDRLLKRVEGLKEIVTVVDRDRPEVAELAVLQQRIDRLNVENRKVAAAEEQYLLGLTVAALDEFVVVLDSYQKQARVAGARLREEFYQIGGRRL